MLLLGTILLKWDLGNTMGEIQGQTLLVPTWLEWVIEILEKCNNIFSGKAKNFGGELQELAEK